MQSQKERMLAGELYNPFEDGELTKERAHCRELCFAFNTTPPNDSEKTTQLLREICASCGEGSVIRASFWCDYGYNVTLGKNFYANHNCVMLDEAPIVFGDNVFVGPNCGFYTAEHPLDVAKRRSGLEYAKPISIGNDVWFGGGVQVLAGVTIGNNVVIGAGSVVTKDIPANSVAVGNPACVIKKLV